MGKKKNLEIAITQMAIDGFFFQCLFCVHIEVLLLKSVLLNLLQFVRVRETHQSHVYNERILNCQKLFRLLVTNFFGKNHGKECIV